MLLDCHSANRQIFVCTRGMFGNQTTNVVRMMILHLCDVSHVTVVRTSCAVGCNDYDYDRSSQAVVGAIPRVCINIKHYRSLCNVSVIKSLRRVPQLSQQSIMHRSNRTVTM